MLIECLVKMLVTVLSKENTKMRRSGGSFLQGICM